MQEIVTLACEKWAAGDKVSVGLLLFANIEILELQALVKILQKYFYFKPKATEALFKEFSPFDPIPQPLHVLPQLLTLSSSMTETKLNKNIFLVFSLQTQEITKNVQTRLQVIYQRNLALVGMRWLEKLSALKYPIQSMINVSE